MLASIPSERRILEQKGGGDAGSTFVRDSLSFSLLPLVLLPLSSSPCPPCVPPPRYRSAVVLCCLTRGRCLLPRLYPVRFYSDGTMQQGRLPRVSHSDVMRTSLAEFEWYYFCRHRYGTTVLYCSCARTDRIVQEYSTVSRVPVQYSAVHGANPNPNDQK